MGTGGSASKRNWKDIFEGRNEKHRLSLGYYCVRLPDDEERKRNPSSQELRDAANQFFRATSPWKDLETQDRLGIQNLVRDISRLLIRILLIA